VDGAATARSDCRQSRHGEGPVSGIRATQVACCGDFRTEPAQRFVRVGVLFLRVCARLVRRDETSSVGVHIVVAASGEDAEQRAALVEGSAA
jgi:hypothetical protein